MATETTFLLPTSQPPSVDYALANSQKLASVLFFTEASIIVLFWIFTTYSDVDTFDNKDYTVYRDIQNMLLLGFGYLMTFMKQYGLGAVGITLLLTAFVVQANILVELAFHQIYATFSSLEMEPIPLPLEFNSIVNAQFCAAAVLISFGAVIGQATPLQMLVIALSETFFYSINKVWFVFGWIGAEDIGGTIYIHLFGASFGLALSYAIGNPQDDGAESRAGPNRISDVISLIGTTILWVYWPTFVAAGEYNDNALELRCYINTVLALCASTAMAFCLSNLLGGGKFEPAEIANATLAGGVGIGVSGRLNIGPGPALLVGFLSGVVSIVGFKYVSPAFVDMGINDNCKVVNLHGWPAVVGGIASAVFVLVIPSSADDFLLHGNVSQCIRQLLAIAFTMLIGGLGGYITGVPTRRLKDDETPSFEDGLWWEGEYFFVKEA